MFVDWIPSFRLGGLLAFTIMLATELENKMNAVERIEQYSNHIEQDAEWTKPKEDEQLDPAWPQQGMTTS
jgi:hypothetical protein